MKKTVRKLIISAFVLVVALSLAVTSTFAWFTMTNTPSVDSFDLNVTTSNGMTMSLTDTAGSYKTRITNADLLDYLISQNIVSASLSEFELDAVTSTDGIAFTDLDNNSVAVSDKKFISFPLYFYSAKALTVKLNSTGNSVARKTGQTVSSVTAWKNISAGEYGKNPAGLGSADTPSPAIDIGEEIDASAANAVRISFVNAAGTSAVKWYPNPDKGFNGDYDYLSVGTGFTPANLGLDYFNFKNLSNVTQPELTYSKNYYVTPVYDGEDKLTTAGNFIINDDLLTLVSGTGVEGEGYYGHITVNIWLEGYDGDCFDSIFADAITVALQFIGA
jgi:hypothetical protein